MVSNHSNPLQDLKEAYIPRAQLTSYPKSHHTLSREYLKEHMISHFEFQFSSPIFSIALLSTLGWKEPLSDELDIINYLLNNIWSQKSSLTNIISIYRGPTCFPV